jgi:hypothetical protein
MSANITISRAAVEYLLRELRNTIECHTPNPDKVERLHGRKFIDGVTKLHMRAACVGGPSVVDGESDLEWLQRDAFPHYLEACAALGKCAGAGKARPPAVAEVVRLTARQRAAFAEVAAFQGATVGETLVVLASLWLSSSSGVRPKVTEAQLRDGFRQFANRGETPTNEMYRHRCA